MMERQEFIYRVAFNEPPVDGGGLAYYFRSLAAIYDLFSNEQVGAALKTLWNHKVSDGTPFVTGKAVISREPLYRKANKNTRAAQAAEKSADV